MLEFTYIWNSATFSWFMEVTFYRSLSTDISFKDFGNIEVINATTDQWWILASVTGTMRYVHLCIIIEGIDCIKTLESTMGCLTGSYLYCSFDDNRLFFYS